jgi:hypothetical protein
MTKGIQAMKQFKRERTMLEWTAATAGYHRLSGTGMVSGRMMAIPDKYFPAGEYWLPAIGSPLPKMAVGVADAPWRAGAVWGS